MYQEEVMVPMGHWAKSRLKNLSDTDKIRDNSKVGRGFGKNISNWLTRDIAYPTNVLHLATECSNKNHIAAFPEELPEWFIKLFMKEHDTVLDPFMGSGTTLIVANRMNLKKNYFGVPLRVGLSATSPAQSQHTKTFTGLSASIPNAINKAA
jgi:site-specific DNA-methyltransferase (adenine-specific)/site-specific DNA-methyltransferase (cytosine-N4-specific)